MSELKPYLFLGGFCLPGALAGFFTHTQRLENIDMIHICYQTDTIPA